MSLKVVVIAVEYFKLNISGNRQSFSATQI